LRQGGGGQGAPDFFKITSGPKTEEKRRALEGKSRRCDEKAWRASAIVKKKESKEG